MSDVKHKDRILDAIDQLRRRKARPDVNRICNYLTRRFAIDPNDIKADLQRCVEREVVLKVEYKGSISYRNAARKFSHLKHREQQQQLANQQAAAAANGVAAATQAAAATSHNHHGSHHEVDASRNFSNLLTNAIAELIVDEPDYLELGVPGPEIIKNILSKDSVKYTKKYVALLLQKEVDSGGLVKMENGHFSMGATKNGSESDKSDAEMMHKDEEVAPHPPPVKIRKKPGPKPGLKRLLSEARNQNNHHLHQQLQDPNGNGYRVGGRRKRAKKVFDPSDNNLPRNGIRKRGRPAGSLNRSTIERQLNSRNNEDSRPGSSASNFSTKDNHGFVCSVCHGKKANEKILHCSECSNKAHFSCLSGGNGVLRLGIDYTWQCHHCKTCVVCFETSDAGYLVICSICADAYHMNCHEPIIDKITARNPKFECVNCQMPNTLSSIEFKPKGAEDDKLNTSVPSKSCTPSGSGHSSPSNYRSLPPSPIPPTLSPQGVHNGGRQSRSSSTEYKYNLSDSQSIKGEDYDLEENIDPSIPDASKWSYDEVYKYFAQYFPEEAIVFKEQEIDGPSLLLMKRLDVLTSLKLKLGPALKIYRHVLKLQIRRDDPKLYWL